ncbi:MAG TPA: hypothetical protein DCL06_06195 [Corynebacterium variabile]|uniref:Uncharacterized protein n=1 Tax=Corynebacterium variabile TaxID=1727 RepID=A0A3B9QU65_9CORY|nr:hypothetical protein [Corynebacterium variabile]
MLPPSSDSPDPAGVPPTWIADPRRARCRVHAGIDSPPPCRDCASAREAAEAVRRDRDAARQSDANHRREAIDACGLCDHNGLVPVDGAGRVGRCPHDADELAAIQDRATAEDADRSSREKSVAAHVAPTRRRWQQESAKRKQRRAAEAAAKAKAEREAAEAAERETAAESGTDPDDAPDDIPDTETR